jgi:single-stranded DNA-binding protein
MARGIEAACWGTAIKDGEVKQSKAGNDFGIVNIAVTEGKTDDAGKELSTYLKILLFSGLAHEAGNIKKGDRCYVEGSLGAEIWNGAIDGKPRLDLSIWAFKFERTQIGKNRPRREHGHEIPASSFRWSSTERKVSHSGARRFRRCDIRPEQCETCSL